MLCQGSATYDARVRTSPGTLPFTLPGMRLIKPAALTRAFSSPGWMRTNQRTNEPAILYLVSLALALVIFVHLDS